MDRFFTNGLGNDLRALKIAIRIPFLINPVSSVILGTTIAWWSYQQFNFLHFLITEISIIFLCISSQLINELYDYLSGADVEAIEAFSPFDDGPKVLPKGLLSPKQVFISFIFFTFIGSVFGLYLVVVRGMVILILGLIGLFSIFFYTAPPLKFQYRGLGEIILGLNFGPLIVLGSYFVQTGEITFEPLFASLSICFLNIGVLMIMKYSTYEADKKVGKRTLIVILGERLAKNLFYICVLFIYLPILIGIYLKIMPYFSLIGLLTLHITFKAVTYFNQFFMHNNINEKDQARIYLLETMKLMSSLFMFLGPAISLGYIIDNALKLGL